jgi:hypothetical protein
MTGLVFVDVETTSLRHPWLLDGRRPWEVSIQHATAWGTPTGPIHTYVVADVDLTYADSGSLSMNGFYERHPLWSEATVRTGTALLTEDKVAEAVAAATHAQVLVAANPGFDAETLAAMLHRHQFGLVAPWHYTPFDVKSAGAAVAGLIPPANTDTVARALGIDPTVYPRHSSAGDVRLLGDLYRAIVARGMKADAQR